MIDWKCPVCKIGTTIYAADYLPVRCLCGYVDTTGRGQLRGLGDWIAKHLHAIGVTPQRFAAMQFWRKPAARRCRCKQRQESLNRWSVRLVRLARDTIGRIRAAW